MNPELLKSQIERLRGIFALLLAVMLCIHHAVGVELPTWMVSAMSLGLLCMCVQRKMQTSLPLGLFLAWLFVCLILHPGNHFHENQLRFLALTVGLLTFSPLLSSSCLNRTRLFLLRCIIITMGVFVVLSSVIWLYSLTLSPDQQTVFYYYGFSGAFNLGFSLASSAALTGLVSLFVILSTSRKSYKVWSGMLLLISCICMIAGASRMVLASFAVSAAVCLMLAGCGPQSLQSTPPPFETATQTALTMAAAWLSLFWLFRSPLPIRHLQKKSHSATNMDRPTPGIRCGSRDCLKSPRRRGPAWGMPMNLSG